MIYLNKAHYPVTTLGPGRRIGLWLQGCTLACPGCVSRDTWGFEPDRALPLTVLLAWCREMASAGLLQWFAMAVLATRVRCDPGVAGRHHSRTVSGPASDPAALARLGQSAAHSPVAAGPGTVRSLSGSGGGTAAVSSRGGRRAGLGHQHSGRRRYGSPGATTLAFGRRQKLSG